MTLFDRIEELRKKSGLSQGKLEKQLGFSNGSISKWKTSTPNPERLQKLATFFGVSVDYLLTGEEKEQENYYLNEETSQIAQDIFENKELRLLFDSARDAEPEDLQAVHNMLLALKRKEQNYDN